MEKLYPDARTQRGVMTTICYMNESKQVRGAGIPSAAGPDQGAGARPGRHYEPPAVTYLGTLHELTLGGTAPAPSDGYGGAGGSGTVGSVGGP
jgi:hypothetical protein